MDRRRFIGLTGIAVTAASTVRSDPSSATGVRWQPDGVGSLARIGILTPDFDPVPESEFWAMAPHGVSIHVARVPRKGAEAYYAAPNIDEAVEQLVAVAPRVIVSAYTSSSYLLGANADDLLRIRLQNRAPGIPVILTC